MVQRSVRHSGTFSVRCFVKYAWRIASIIFNNVSLCPLILISQYVRPAVSALIKPGQSGLPGWMRATHYTARASRNECSTVGACSLHVTQVPNSCRKWHNIYILFSFTVHCTCRIPLFDEWSMS